MQHAYSDFPHFQQEYEHVQEQQYATSRNRIDSGEKILPRLREKRRVHRLMFRLILAFVSLIILFAVSAAIVVSPQQIPDLTVVDLLLTFATIGGINAIVNLLLDRAPGRTSGKRSVWRIVFAVASVILTPILCWMMIEGYNGPDGVSLFLVIAVFTNAISYLTHCRKRER